MFFSHVHMQQWVILVSMQTKDNSQFAVSCNYKRLHKVKRIFSFWFGYVNDIENIEPFFTIFISPW
jgi:hypothetical protein